MHIFLLILLCTNNANAFDVTTYEKLKQTSMETLKVHISAIGESYSWSNVFLEERGDKAFYCVPDKLGLNASNLMDIIDKKVKDSKKDLSGAPIELVLFMGLVDTFPCTK